MKKLSAIVITKNEEQHIGECLASVCDLADELVVVDSGSTDRTVEIAKGYGVRLYRREFDDFATQRNFAIAKANGEWILSLDADERVPEELALEIKEEIFESKFDGFLIPRRNIIFGKEIKYSRWAPDKHVWLFRKNKGRFSGVIHEEAVVEGQVGELKEAKIHYSHRSVFDFLEMINRYTSVEADRVVEGGGKFNIYRFFRDPLRSFVGRYFVKLGFLDGWRGFVLAYLMAIYRMVVWVKVWERRR